MRTRLNRIFRVCNDFVNRQCVRIPILCPPKYLVYGKTADGKNGVTVLTPADYWVRRADLNVSSENEAARFGHSLFDLDEPFVCVARKATDGQYEVIAYNPETLHKRYPELFASSDTRRVTFAQWAYDDVDHPIRLENGRYLSRHEGILFEMEAGYVASGDSVAIEQVESVPRYGIKTLTSGSMAPTGLSSRTITVTVTVLVLILANLALEAYRLKKNSAEVTARMEASAESSGLQGVSMEREAILDTLRHKEAKQLKLRERCYALRDIPLHPVSAVSTASPATTVQPVTPSSGGVVLIPGSRPGEPNRLLVNGNVNSPLLSAGAQEGIREISFDGKQTSMVIESSDPDTLKKWLAKHFRNSRIEMRGGRLEMRLK